MKEKGKTIIEENNPIPVKNYENEFGNCTEIAIGDIENLDKTEFLKIVDDHLSKKNKGRFYISIIQKPSITSLLTAECEKWIYELWYKKRMELEKKIEIYDVRKVF